VAPELALRWFDEDLHEANIKPPDRFDAAA
jgi:hypothetical protein